MNLNKKTNYKGMKAILIARVSDPSQVDALPAQELRLREYAEQLGLDATLESFDETAYKEDRRKFQEIVDEIAHFEGEMVVVFDKIDRFTRDASSEVVRILKDRVKDGKLELHFPSDGLVFHKNSPACDKTRLGMGMVFGEYYSAAISDNVKRKIELKLHDGEFPGKAPIGYINIDLPDGKKDIVPDPERRKYIEKIFELRLKGETFRSIAKIMRSEGMTSNTKHPKPVSKSVVEGILDNPFYYGVMRYNGNLYQHKYEPIIDKMTYDKVQARRNCCDKLAKNKSDTKYHFAFNGILKCAVCGCSMSSYYKKGHIYVKCSQAKGKCGNHASEAEVLSQVYSVLDKICISQTIIDELIEDLKKKHDNIQLYYRNAIEEVRKSIESATKKKEILYEDRLSGRITVDDYDKIATRIETEISELDDKLMELTNNDRSFDVSRSYLLELASKARVLFENSKPEQKNKILKLLFSNLEINQKRLNFHLLEPFETLSTLSKTSNWLPRPDSNWQPRS